MYKKNIRESKTVKYFFLWHQMKTCVRVNVYTECYEEREIKESILEKKESILHTHTHKTHPYVFKKILGLDGEWLDSTVALLTRDPS